MSNFSAEAPDEPLSTLLPWSHVQDAPSHSPSSKLSFILQSLLCKALGLSHFFLVSFTAEQITLPCNNLLSSVLQ